mmetsp:Transcript_12259/g.23753  ORF Transcript_12259/g.23753 Transcript_12259/m.23753 type:complete len:90 (-) Transcript_12259:1154-1423(-)
MNPSCTSRHTDTRKENVHTNFQTSAYMKLTRKERKEGKGACKGEKQGQSANEQNETNTINERDGTLSQRRLAQTPHGPTDRIERGKRTV